jgi:hypothetical protein
MAVVPRYDEPTVQNAAIVTPRAQAVGADAFGAGLAKGLSQVGGVAFDAAEKQAKMEAQTGLYKHRVAVDGHESYVGFGDDKKPGFFGLRGEDAAKNRDAYLEEFKTRLDSSVPKDASPDLKRAIEQINAERYGKLQGQFDRHALSESQTANDAAAKAMEESTIKNIGNYYNDDARFGQELSVLRHVIETDAETKGQGVELKKLRLETMTSRAYSERFDRILGVSPKAAKDFFDKNRDSMTSADQHRHEQALKPLVTKQIGMETAIEMAPLLGAKPLTEVLGEVRTKLKSDPDALNIAETQLKQMEAERRDQIKQVRDETAAPIYKRIAGIQLSGRAAKLSDIPANEWTALVKADPEEAGKIQDAIRREQQGEEDRKERKLDRAERQADRKERKSEAGTMTQLLNWSALNGDPVSLMGANLDKMYTEGLLGKEHYRSLSTKQADLRADPDKGTAIRTEAATVEDVLGAGGMKKSTEDHSLAWDYVESRKKSYVAESGKQPTRKELETFAREALYKVDVSGKWRDQPAYKVGFEDIPAKERAKITDSFNRRGRPYTEAEVVRAYVVAKGKR